MIEVGPTGTWRGDPMGHLTVQSTPVPQPLLSRTLSAYSTALHKLTSSISRFFRQKIVQISQNKICLETILFFLSLLIYELTRLIA